MADKEHVTPGKEESSKQSAYTLDVLDSPGASQSTLPGDEDGKIVVTYGIEETPPILVCILLGFQHYMTMFGATVVVPFILVEPLCMEKDLVAKARLISTIFFVSGICTMLQTIWGVRLPIVQGSTFSFLAPTFAILSLVKPACPSDIDAWLKNNPNSTMSDLWRPRILEIQGAIAVASLFQVVIGFSGIIGLLLRFIGPLSIAPCIALVGLSLFRAAYTFCATHWGISIFMIVMITIFSQYLRNIGIPFCQFDMKKRSCSKISLPLFTLFPVIFGIAIVWTTCYLLTHYNVLPNNSTMFGYAARTDVRISVIQDTPWFRFPHPGQWGLPTVSAAGVFGMLAGVLASMIESVGDYYACARLAGAPPPPTHAINRGIGIEGIGCMIAGMIGSGNGTTSFSENIGAIGITKVGSRRVIQVGAILMIIFGVIGKIGAIFVSLPDPIIGGLFMTMFGMVASVGISNLQFANMNSSRNLYIFGLSIMAGIAIPEWLNSLPADAKPIDVGVEEVNQIIIVLLKTHMFIGGVIGFVLDNTVPGTLQERGLLKWRQQLIDERSDDRNTASCYELPFGMRFIRKWKWTRYVPICPTFSPNICSCPCKKKNQKSQNGDLADNFAHGSSTTVDTRM